MNAPDSPALRSAQPDPRFPALPTAAAVRELQAALARWFEREQRDLPWRRNKQAYAIWVSEAMLQQTRVEVVIDYFERFMRAFPTVSDLARAELDEVLALWSGLGYYRRARALHAAANEIVANFSGSFPTTRDEVLSLPGVGPYTAGAVLSIAFDQREALVDGNVERVFCRLFGFDAPSGSRELVRALWSTAAELVATAARPGDWNQALMELGATVCTPRDPDCEHCAVAAWCAARRDERVDELPRKKERAAPTPVELEVLLVRGPRGLLLERRPLTGRMAGMWQLPTRERGVAAHLFPTAWPAALSVDESRKLGEVRHSITRYRIRAELFVGRSASGEPGANLAWFEANELGGLALTGLTKKAIKLAEGPRLSR